MKVKELKELLNDLDDNADVTIIDDGQNYAYNIAEGRICEDKTSPYYRTYIDLVIEEEDLSDFLYDLEKTYNLLSTLDENNVLEKAQIECRDRFNISETLFNRFVTEITADELASIYRQAENIYQDDLNGRSKYSFSGTHFKELVLSAVDRLLGRFDQETFYDIINSSAC